MPPRANRNASAQKRAKKGSASQNSKSQSTPAPPSAQQTQSSASPPTGTNQNTNTSARIQRSSRNRIAVQSPDQENAPHSTSALRGDSRSSQQAQFVPTDAETSPVLRLPQETRNTDFESDEDRELSPSSASEPVQHQSPPRQPQRRVDIQPNSNQSEIERYKNALRATQKELHAARQQLQNRVQPASQTEEPPAQEATGEAGNVHARTNTRTAAEDEDEVNRPVKKAKTVKEISNVVLLQVLRSGKAYTTFEIMFRPPGFWLAISTDEDAEQDDQEELAEEEEDNRTRLQIARDAFIRIVPSDIMPWFSHSVVRSRFDEGARAVRANFVSKLVEQHALVFKIVDPAFKDKSTRREMPEVRELLQDEHFLYDPGSTSLTEGFLRNPCILKALTLHLWGARTLVSGSTRRLMSKQQIKHTNADLWGRTEVTDALLAFTCTGVYFVLSCEPEFTERGPNGTNFLAFWQERLEMLATYRKQLPNKYKKLMKYFNTALFGDEDGEGPDTHNKCVQRFLTEVQEDQDDLVFSDRDSDED